jgi:hypothetical protein
MGDVRIRWRGVAKVAAIALVGLLAVRLLPSLLRAPEPPPVAADVGLPKATPVTDVPRPAGTTRATDVPRPARHPRKRRRPSRQRRSRPHKVRDAPAAKAVIGSKRRHRVAARPAHDLQKVTESTPPPAPRYVPPPIPEAAPERLPEPSPAPRSTPGDGSQEFAPH